jgi:NTP pyrophosphatase (non-canonical NTP hydrolase)
MNHENQTAAGYNSTAKRPGDAYPGRPSAMNQLMGASEAPRRAPSPLDTAHDLIKADQEHRSLRADQAIMLRMVTPFFRESMNQLTQGLFRWFQHVGFWPDRGGVVARMREVINPFSYFIEEEAKKYHGFTDDDLAQIRLYKMEKLGLIGTEIAEAMEAVRQPNFGNEAEELADTLIRIFDYAGGFGIDLSSAVEAKMMKNYQRPMKHGKAF